MSPGVPSEVRYARSGEISIAGSHALKGVPGEWALFAASIT